MKGSLRVVGVSGSISAARVPTVPEVVALADLAPSLAGALHRGDAPLHLEATGRLSHTRSTI